MDMFLFGILRYFAAARSASMLSCNVAVVLACAGSRTNYVLIRCLIISRLVALGSNEKLRGTYWPTVMHMAAAVRVFVTVISSVDLP